MENKSLDNLEFSRILSLVAECAGSRSAKEAILKLEPSDNANIVEGWLREIDEYLQYSQIGFKLNPSGLRDIREILEILRSGIMVLGSEDFLKVKANIEVAITLKKSFESNSSGTLVKESNRLSERIKRMPSLIQVFQRIDDCLDQRGQIRNDASPVLTSVRREYTSSVSQIEKQLNIFLGQHSSDVQDRYFTLRNDRYCIPVLASSQSQIQGIVHDQSSTGQTLFIEPLSFLPANNRLAQLRLSEREEIKRIFTNLTTMLKHSVDSIHEQFETLTWLDMVKARADFAIKFQANRPEIVPEINLVLRSARHPLLHPNCVPLDISMNDSQRCIIITGPNGGGKSVSLKTVGVNALLMQTGNYVLANHDAKLPIFTQILSDIGESQSIDEHLSTFTAHLRRLREISELAGARSLVLIDEICVGTDPVEGGALASGFLKEITSRGAFSIVTSHYDLLKQVAFTTPSFINAAMEFDYQTFKPTFRFQIGIPGKSNALAMARTFNLPESMLVDLVKADAGELQHEKGLIEAIERERNRAEALRRTYVDKISRLRSREAEVEEALTQLKEFRKTKRDKLTEEYTVQLRKRITEIESLINRLRLIAQQAEKTGNTVKSDELASALEQTRNLHSTARKLIVELDDAQKEADVRVPIIQTQATLKELKAGMRVIWSRNMQIGVLIRINRERADVEFDGKNLQVPIAELAPAPKVGKKNSKKTSGSVYAVRPLVRSEIDLRGKRVEEAIDEVESYLKIASEANLGRVFIIHGKGTGALQKAVADYLKKSPWKKKFRSGRYGEGDLGVTVVVFDASADVDKLDPRYKH